MIPTKLRQILRRGAIYLIGRNKHHRPVKGLPAGVSFTILNELCRRYLGERLKHVSHVHISGWKSAGAYRLLLQTNSGRSWSLIYKNAIYGQDHIPALAGLPVKPGVPEYLIYFHSYPPLKKYLPRVYYCFEVIPGLHYKYFLEDLCSDFHSPRTQEERLRVVAALPTLHKILDSWAQSIDQTLLLKYDRQFSDDLLKYVKKNLQMYLCSRPNKAVLKVLKLWAEILDMDRSKEFNESQSMRTIHGDLNATNIMIHKQDPNQIKIIDWEWAGLGPPHADLASLLKYKTPELEQKVLEIFANRSNGLPLDQHKRNYLFCKLERGLFDAAFFAAQQFNFATPNCLKKAIEASIKRALQAYKDLV